jgi:hypothetical protein
MVRTTNDPRSLVGALAEVQTMDARIPLARLRR